MTQDKQKELLETAAANADQAILAINRDRDAGAAIALSTLAISQALIAIGVILRDFGGKKNANGQKEIPG